MYIVEKKYDSIGCYYTFDRCVIVSSEIKLNESGDKVLKMFHKLFNHLDVENVVKELKDFKSSRKIKINKNTGVNIYFSGLLTEIDIKNQDEIDSIVNVYKSLVSVNKLIFETDFDKSKNINLQALYLCLYKFKITKLNDDTKRNSGSYRVSGIAG